MFQPNSEVTLGQIGAPKKFAIHTKAPGLSPGSMSKQKILEGMEKALKELQVDRVQSPKNTLPGQRLTYHFRLTYTTCMLQTLELQLRRPCPRSRNFTPPGSSNVYMIPYPLPATQVSQILKCPPKHSSASLTTSPPTSKRSTTSKHPRTPSYPQSSKETTMQFPAMSKTISSPCSTNSASVSTPTLPSPAASS